MAIYIMRAKGGPVKIGFTSGSPLKRLSSIRVASFAEVELCAYFEGTREDEKRLHRKFSKFRLSGEWFEASDEIVEFISSLPPPTVDKNPGKLWKYTDEITRREMRSAWFDKSIKTNAEVAKKFGVTTAWLTMHLGASGRPTLTPERAKELADARHDEKRKGWLPYDDARVIWGSPAQFSETAALLAMKGWPRSTAYATFGKRKDLEKVLLAEQQAARPKRAPAKKSKPKAKR